MGGGVYSSVSHDVRSDNMGYKTKSTAEVFTQRQINNAMNPYGISIRESRDSEEHPNSLAIILGLDVTGSMGSVPHFLVKTGLPNIMDAIIEGGIKDPQVLFLGIGDHTVDDAPLQVSQFESSDELLDKWLTDIYLEGGGGGNEGESYLFSWYFAAKHTSIDCFEKRKQKGFLFTIGDEPVLKTLPSSAIKEVMGTKQSNSYNSLELLNMAQKFYNVYHIHIKETTSGSRQFVIDDWKQLINENLIIVEHKEDTANSIGMAIKENYKLNVIDKKEEEIIL